MPLGVFGVDLKDHQAGAEAAEHQRRFPPYAGTPARDQDDLVTEIEHTLSSLVGHGSRPLRHSPTRILVLI